MEEIKTEVSQENQRIPDESKRSLLEALLFLSGEPLQLSSVKKIVDISEDEFKRVMSELMTEYNNRAGGIIIAEVAQGYQMVTNPKYGSMIKTFRGVQASNKLSIAALETLAIIAYKQPIIKAEIERIRGVNSDGVLKTLLDKRLIKIVGKKDAPGRPLYYGTTQEFLQYFGLRDLTELPTVKDLSREEVM